jgi:hypothetical protein
MPINPHVFGPARLNTTVLAVTDISVEATAATDLIRLQHSANRFNSVTVRASSEPRIRFSTPVKPALDLLGVDGLRLTVAEAWMCKFADFRRTATASDDAKIDMNANCHAFAYIDSISASQGQMAMANVVVEILLGTATTEEAIKLGTGDIPTLGAEPALHTIGPIAHNGSRIDGVRSLNLGFGHQFIRLPSDGDVVARNGLLAATDPTMTAEVVDPPQWLTALGIVGAPITTSLAMWLRAFDTDQTLATTGLNLASGANSGRIMVTDASGQAGSNATANVAAVFQSATDTNPWTYTASGTVP